MTFEVINKLRNRESFDFTLEKAGALQHKALTVDNAFDAVTSDSGVITTNVNAGFKYPTAETFLKRILDNTPIAQDALRVNMPSLQLNLDILDVNAVLEFSRNTTGVLGQSKGYEDLTNNAIDLSKRTINAIPREARIDIPEGFVEENINDTNVLADISKQIALKIQAGMDDFILTQLNLTATTKADSTVSSALNQAIEAFNDGDVVLTDATVYVASDIYVPLLIELSNNDAINGQFFTIQEGRIKYLSTVDIVESKTLPSNSVLISEKGNIVVGVHGDTRIRMLYGFYDDLIGYRTIADNKIGVTTFYPDSTKLYTLSF